MVGKGGGRGKGVGVGGVRYGMAGRGKRYGW